MKLTNVSEILRYYKSLKYSTYIKIFQVKAFRDDPVSTNHSRTAGGNVVQQNTTYIEETIFLAITNMSDIVPS